MRPTGYVSELGDFLAGSRRWSGWERCLANQGQPAEARGPKLPTVAVLCKGNTLAILGEEKGWYHVQAIANGQVLEGFVWGEYVALG